MEYTRVQRAGIIAAVAWLLAGCASWPLLHTLRSDRSQEVPGLSLIVSELQIHLRDDTYRFDRALTPEGRNVFAIALWRLDRLQSDRNVPKTEWANVDVVIEFARARSLERLRRYSEAAAVYDQVAQTGSVLAEPAARVSLVMHRFARDVGFAPEPFEDPIQELLFIEQRIETWQQLAWTHRGTLYDPLAHEESEVWEMLRVEWFVRNRGPENALTPCRRLVERHRRSKLYARHLIRLGDLYAVAARAEQLRARTRVGSLNADRYEQFLDRAFAAYELAGEQRKPALRHEAKTKIDALLAFHQGTLAHAP